MKPASSGPRPRVATTTDTEGRPPVWAEGSALSDGGLSDGGLWDEGPWVLRPSGGLLVVHAGPDGLVVHAAPDGPPRSSFVRTE